jgi:hypothetical protein
VRLPYAYLAPSVLGDRLLAHGIAFETLTASEEMLTESYLVVGREETFSPDVAATVAPFGEGELPQSAAPPPVRFETVLSVRAEKRRVRIPAGTLVVPTAQRAGILAAYLLEPHSDDGFTRWQFLDACIEVGKLHPVHRLLDEPSPRTKQE